MEEALQERIVGQDERLLSKRMRTSVMVGKEYEEDENRL